MRPVCPLRVAAQAHQGVLLTPFHNMALMSPAASASDVDRHTQAFRRAVNELVGSTAAV